MQGVNWIEAIISILSGLAVCIPLVIKVYDVVKESVKNKNWNMLIGLILDQMKIAQTQFAKGYERKEYVMNMLLDLATKANYPLEEEDIAKISNMIDDMCDMANVVGVKS